MPKTEPEATKPEVIMLTGECEGCGAPGGLYLPSRGEHRCPDCAAMMVRYHAAWRSLEELTAQLYVEWSKHWKAQGLSELEMQEIREYVGDGTPAPR